MVVRNPPFTQSFSVGERVAAVAYLWGKAAVKQYLLSTYFPPLRFKLVEHAKRVGKAC